MEEKIVKRYFDCFDGCKYQEDEFGIELEDDNETRDHAIALVQALLNDGVPDHGMRSVSVTVRTPDSARIFVVHGTLMGAWVEDHSLPRP